jgi:hypothetical protein
MNKKILFGVIIVFIIIGIAAISLSGDSNSNKEPTQHNWTVGDVVTYECNPGLIGEEKFSLKYEILADNGSTWSIKETDLRTNSSTTSDINKSDYYGFDKPSGADNGKRTISTTWGDKSLTYSSIGLAIEYYTDMNSKLLYQEEIFSGTYTITYKLVSASFL